VRDDARTTGLGRRLYGTFTEAALARGATSLKAIINPRNTGSRAFHRRMGFTEMASFDDYGGSGRPRIVVRKQLAADGH
jgi:L-amino acid N-acyltransferase YncA